MTTVFLSYSNKDYFFAELAEIRLAEGNVRLWRDQDQLRAGTDWRQGIERAISGCAAVLVALSPHSAESSYVTYEWAYALGREKAIIPLKLAPCAIHPRLETIQNLSFENKDALPWGSLIERIHEIETDREANPENEVVVVNNVPADPDDALVKAILAYLDQRGYQVASFDRIRRRVDENLTDERLDEIINKYLTIFRRAILKGGRPGIAKRIS